MLSQGGVNAQPLEVNDFSGGMTDDFISAAQNKFQKADNSYKNFDKRLVTRPGLTPSSTVNPRIPTELKIQTIFDAENQLFQLSDGKIYYDNSGFTHVQGPTANKALILGDTSTFTSWTPWNKHVILSDSKYSPVMRLFKDGATWKAHQLGLPALASTPTITGSGVGFSYLYAFHYKVTYTSSGNTFEELGPVRYSGAISNSAAPNTAPINLTAIPVLSNGIVKNFDTVNIKVVIYRTTNAGNVFYKVGEVTNTNTIFFDNFSDASIALIANEIYTTGDVP